MKERNNKILEKGEMEDSQKGKDEWQYNERGKDIPKTIKEERKKTRIPR